MGDMTEPSPRLRPRFKGIENLLRRIAFNLGNTPSQTEVKVISCVPIDVTDLQTKIVELEKELDARTNIANIVNTAVGVPVLSPRPLALPPLQEAPPAPRNKDSIRTQDSTTPKSPVKTTKNNTRPRKRETPKANGRRPNENVQMVYYAETTTNAMPLKNRVKFERKRKTAAATNKDKDANKDLLQKLHLPESYMADVLQRQYGEAEPSSSSFSWPLCRDEQPSAHAATSAPRDSDVCSCLHAGYQDLDRGPEPRRVAQAPAPHPALRECHHYYDSSMYDLVPVRDTPLFGIKEMSEESFCLDLGSAERPPPPCERSQGTTYWSPTHTLPSQTVMYANVIHRPAYKMRYKTKMPSKSTFKRDQVLKTMQRRKADPRLGTEASRTSCVELGNVYAKRIPCTSPPPPPPPSIPASPPPFSRPFTPVPPPVELKNAECLTDSVCLTATATSRSVQLDAPCPIISKTEITLNQIKSILHAVLTEVKTNAMKMGADNRPMKDAVVQNMQSHSTIPNCPEKGADAAAAPDVTNFMAQSYIYPYNMNPYSPFTSSPRYGMGEAEGGAAGGATAMPTGPYGPPKGLQQYPLFIQAPPRCSCCYRSAPQRAPSAARPGPHPQAMPVPLVSAETVDNTKQSRNRETDNLVKEIYKSLYMDYAHPTSSSKSHSQTMPPVFKLSKLPKGSRSEAPARDAKLVRETSASLESGSLIGDQKTQGASSLSYTTSSSSEPTPAQGVSSSDTNRTRALPPQFLLEPQEPTETSATTANDEEEEEEEEGEDEEAEEEQESETLSTDDTASDRTVRPQRARARAHQRERQPDIHLQQEAKGKKVGLFSKMMQLFTPKPRPQTNRRKKVDHQKSDHQKGDHQKSDRQELSSDDDYETVYSEPQSRPDRRDQRGRFQPPLSLRYPASPASVRDRYPQAPASRRGWTYSKVSRSRYNIARNASRSAQHRRQDTFTDQEYRRFLNKVQTYQATAPPAPAPRYPPERGGRGDRGPREARGERAPPRQRPPFWQEYEARLVLPPPAPRILPPGTGFRSGQANNMQGPMRQAMPAARAPAGAETAAAASPESLEQPSPSKGKSLSWLKKALPTMPQIAIPQCGVQWKELLNS